MDCYCKDGTCSIFWWYFRNDLDPDNPAVKQMEARRDRLVALEKRLDLQMQDYQNRLAMVSTELQSCQGAVNNAIKNSFSYSM